MTEEARAARNAYRREWARKNPDKVKAQQARHWEKVAREEQEARKTAAAARENFRPQAGYKSQRPTIREEYRHIDATAWHAER